MYWIGEGLDPETALNQGSGLTRRNRIGCNRDKFLRQVCVVLGDKRYSARDIIAYLANTAGAVHYESLPDKEGQLMRELDHMIKLAGQHSIHYQLRPIIRITLRALRPLRDKLHAQLASG